MRTLLAVKSCWRNSDRRQAVRETWLPSLTWCPYFFILGLPPHIPNARLRHRRVPATPPVLEDDCQQFAVDDSFRNIAPKIRAVAMYALAREFDTLIVCDDDVYLRPERLRLFLGLHHADVLAYLRPTYPQGSLTIYNRRALDVLATSEELHDAIPDDVAVGKALAGMAWTHVPQFDPGPVPKLILPSNDLISSHKALPVSTRQFPHSMYSVHALFKNGGQPCQ
jgi:hypothetical protein